MGNEPRRFTLLEDDEIVLDVEYTDTACILHIHTVKVFNRAVLNRLVTLSDNLADWLIPQYGALFTYADKDRKDLIKLARYMKYENVGVDGNNIIYRRTLCQQQQ